MAAIFKNLLRVAAGSGQSRKSQKPERSWAGIAPDRYTLADMADSDSELAARREINLLMDDTVEIAGARFLGSTLWTNFVMPPIPWHTPQDRRGAG